MVFGISTPGPIDKQPGAKKGPVGREEYTSQQFVSRLGGSTFVMDDGDDKFLRMTKAGDGPPTYAAVEQGDTSGDPTIPHNELFRIRTRTGHQILLHNSEDLIYIANSRGTAWIELTSNGKIDIYAKDSISLHTANDFNITADRDINFTATGDINLNSGANINQQTAADFNAKIGGTAKINPGGDFQVLAANTAIDGGNINLNSGAATAATPTPKAGRIPQTEPWPGHENLDPTSVTPDNTKATTSPTTPTPAAFGMYTTKTDTFNKVQGGS
jgi:cell division septation protein DedD